MNSDIDVRAHMMLSLDADGRVDVGRLVMRVVRWNWVDGHPLADWNPDEFEHVSRQVNRCLVEGGCAVTVRVSLSGSGGDVDWVALATRWVTRRDG